MTMIGMPDRAQCATCGGLLVPAGDDWTHVDDTGCTHFGAPVLCSAGDCVLPAVVGSLACNDHTGRPPHPRNI